MTTPPQILESMAETYRLRNAVYGDNWRTVGAVMQALHAQGVHLNSARDHNVFHLWSLLIVKLTRFANSRFSHKDSIHDAAVYAAMIESILESEAQQPLTFARPVADDDVSWVCNAEERGE